VRRSGLAMRILVVANLYPNPANPAFGTFVAARVAALRRAGATVDVIAIRGGGVHQQIGRKYLSLASRVLCLAAWRALSRRRYRVVEAHIAYPTGWVALPAAYLHRAKLVLYAHGADVIEIPNRSRMHRRLAASLFKRADLIVANSRFLAAEIESRFSDLPRSVVVLSPGYDPQLFHAEGAQSRQGVLFVGRLVPEKGLDVLLHALARLHRTPRPRLTILGDGPERARMETLAAELAIDAVFRGSVPHPVVAEEMRRALVVVVPSNYRQEALGLAAVEGLASGAVVVGSAVGGLPEVLEGIERGILVAPNDPDALAGALDRALGIASETLGRPAPQSMARLTAHDINRVALASLELYSAPESL